jgi:hypothetical protein
VLLKAIYGEGKSGATQWMTSQSSFVYTYLTNLVLEGNKISIGFKKVVLRLSIIILRSIGLLIRFLIT